MSKRKIRQFKRDKDNSKQYSYSIYRAIKQTQLQIPGSTNSITVNTNEYITAPSNMNHPSLIREAPITKYAKELPTEIGSKAINNKLIAVFRYGGIGDIIASLFAIIEFKKKHPSCHIAYCCSEQYADILNIFPDIVQFRMPTIERLKHFQTIDYFVDLENAVEINDNKPIQDIFADKFGVEVNEKTIDEILKRNLVLTHNSNIKRDGIGIQYSCGSFCRSYPIEKIIELINKLIEIYPNKKIYLLGKPDDYLNVNYIQSKVSKPEVLVPHGCNYPKYQLDKYTHFIINKLEVIIGVDSSMLHLGGVTNVPIIGLFGPINPEYRISYYNESNYVYYKSDCSFCQGHFPFSSCQYTNGIGLCMQQIEPNDIISILTAKSYIT